MRIGSATPVITLFMALSAACTGGTTEDGPSQDDRDGGDAGDAGDPSDGGELPPSPLVVTTQYGELQGTVSEGVRAFLGIPFAKPPSGERRWKAPEPPTSWQGVRAATSYAASCAQLSPSGSAFDPSSSEDCLYLNVWAPTRMSAAKLPVMVWIYGGAFVFGNGGPPYNGENLVRDGNVIVVTMNYRLGPLGFMAHPAISAEAEASGGAKSNFALLDQRLALQWVRDNIEAFGGDRDNVTLFGESAGANCSTRHLISEGSWGLFQKAIIESGAVMTAALNLAEAEAQGSGLAASLGCAQTDPASALACLRALSPDLLLKRPRWEAAGGLSYQESGRGGVYMPVIDGQILKEQSETAFAAGHVAPVPILHGVNADEGVLFHIGIFGDRLPANMGEYATALRNRLGQAGAEKVMARYPDITTGLVTVSGDAVYRCPAVRMARYLSRRSAAQYVYLFDLTVDATFPSLQGRAFHSAEIPYVFGNSYLLGSLPPQGAAASRTIMGYWTRFAKTGDPNGSGSPDWPRWQSSSEVHLNLADPIATGTNLPVGCDFWEGVPISAP